MKRRLFWKILVSFWLTFTVIANGVWVMVDLFGDSHRPHKFDVFRELAEVEVSSAVTALRYGGLPALRETTASWPNDHAQRLRVTAADAPAETGPDAPAVGNGAPAVVDPHEEPIVVEARAPDQTVYLIRYDMGGVHPHPHPPGLLRVPPEMVALGIVGGFLFSAALAWYLTKPLQRLRNGFGRLAAGDLKVRLGPSMGNRRDELADLAQDFDWMAERLQLLMSLREQLLHDVSHELRSPLARLHLAIGLARQHPVRFQSSLDRIEFEAGRLDELVGELLTLSRAEAGAPQLDNYFDLDSLVGAVVDDARFEAQAFGILIKTNIEPGGGSGETSPTVRGDAMLIRRAVENVVRNALRHSVNGQTVAIDVTPDWSARSFLIRVGDEGPGVEPDALSVMFEPFVRLHGAATGQGLGLGLAIARRAVQAHGGWIKAENRPERGLMVTICLPFGPMPSSEPDQPQGEAARERGPAPDGDGHAPGA